MAVLLNVVLYLFTIVAFIALLASAPVLLLDLAMARRPVHSKAREIAVALSVVAGFLLGVAAGWFLRILPGGWSMPFGDTLAAAFSADHTIEHVAERILLFLIFCGDVGALILGLSAAWLLWRGHRIRVVS